MASQILMKFQMVEEEEIGSFSFDLGPSWV